MIDREAYKKIILDELNKVIVELLSNGRKEKDNDIYAEIKAYLKAVSEQLYIYKDSPPNVIYDLIIDRYLKTVKGIASIVPGLTTAISDDKTGLSLETYSGVSSQNGPKIDENTRFDYASITKLFTAVEALKLQEEGKLDLNKSVRELSDGEFDLDVSADRLSKFGISLKTQGRIDEKDITKEDFEKRLHTIMVREDIPFEYNDILYIILKMLMPKDDDYFSKYFHDEMRLLDTSYRKFGLMTGGSVAAIDLPYDPKAKQMYKFGYFTPGHAGLFGTSRDLVKFHKNLRLLLSDNSISELIKKVDINNEPNEEGKTINQNRAMGVYINIPGGLETGEVVPYLSKGAFSAAGSSGGYATYDISNGLTANFLSNPYSTNIPFMVDTSDPKFNFGDAVDSNKLLRVDKKKIELYDKNGEPIRTIKDGKTVLDSDGNEVIETIKLTTITNELKNEQIKTLLGLRLANKVLYRVVNELMTKEDNQDLVRRRLDDSNLGNNTAVVKKNI